MAEELNTDLWHLTLQFLDIQTQITQNRRS